MISIKTETTTRTHVAALIEPHFLPMPAPAARLTGIRRIYSDHSLTGPFCLVFEKSGELRP